MGKTDYTVDLLVSLFFFLLYDSSSHYFPQTTFRFNKRFFQRVEFHISIMIMKSEVPLAVTWHWHGHWRTTHWNRQHSLDIMLHGMPNLALNPKFVCVCMKDVIRAPNFALHNIVFLYLTHKKIAKIFQSNDYNFNSSLFPMSWFWPRVQE